MLPSVGVMCSTMLRWYPCGCWGAALPAWLVATATAGSCRTSSPPPGPGDRSPAPPGVLRAARRPPAQSPRRASMSTAAFQATALRTALRATPPDLPMPTSPACCGRHTSARVNRTMFAVQLLAAPPSALLRPSVMLDVLRHSRASARPCPRTPAVAAFHRRATSRRPAVVARPQVVTSPMWAQPTIRYRTSDHTLAHAHRIVLKTPSVLRSTRSRPTPPRRPRRWSARSTIRHVRDLGVRVGSDRFDVDPVSVRGQLKIVAIRCQHG